MGILDGIKQRANQARQGLESGLNEVKKTAGQAVDVVQDTVESGVNEVKKTAAQAADTLINTAEDAQKRVTQTVDRTVQNVQHAIDHPFETVNRAADRLGEGVNDAGKLLSEGGRKLDGIVPFADEIQQLGQDAQTLGRGIQDAPEVAAQTAGQVADQVEQLGNQAQQLYNRAETAIDQGIEQGKELAQEGLQMVRDGITGITDAGKAFVTDVATAVDYNKQIDELGPGDKYTLGLGGDASVEGVKVYGKGQIEVERKGNQYVVSVDGELGGGLYAEIGGKLGPAKASGSAEALLGLGGKMEMTFNSPEEARRATEILLRQAASSAASGAASSTPLVGPLAGMATNALTQPSAADMQFLAERTSAVEFRGNVAAGIAGTLGVANKHTRLAGLFGKAGVKEELTARLEFNGNQAPSITFKGEVSGEVALGGGIGLSDTGGKQDGAATGLGVGVNGQGKIAYEQRFELPATVDRGRLMQDPLGTIGTMADQIGRSRQDKLSFTLQGEADAVGNDAGFKAQLDFTGKIDDVVNSGALQRAVQGDFGGALQRAGDQVQVDAKITPYRSHGLSLNPGISLMGFGVGVEGKAIRQDFADQPMWQYQGTATQAAGDIQQQLQNAAEFVRQNPELIQARTPQIAFPLRG